jgi:hypothetical protein
VAKVENEYHDASDCRMRLADYSDRPGGINVSNMSWKAEAEHRRPWVEYGHHVAYCCCGGTRERKDMARGHGHRNERTVSALFSLIEILIA